MSVEHNSRSRNWFLCVHKGAECFDNLASICERLSNCTYAYILHDEEHNFLNEVEIGGKPQHYHVLLVFDNARTFSSISKTFSGAHCEVSHVLADCAVYLLHNTPSAIKAGKKQYDVSEIVTNNREALNSWLGDKSLKFEPFNENRILEYIVLDDCRSVSEFFMRFGSVIQRYIPLIKALIEENSGIIGEVERKYILYASFIQNIKTSKLKYKLN